MKKVFFLLLTVLCSATAATYSYNVYNPSGTAFVSSDLNNWPAGSNHGMTCYQAGSGCPVLRENGWFYPGASMMWTAAGTAYFEVSIELAAAPGVSDTDVIYLNASTDAQLNPGGTDQGSFDAIQLYDSSCAPNGSCTIGLQFFERKNSQTTSLGATAVIYTAGTLPRLRAVSTPGAIRVLVGDQFYQAVSTLTSGYPGVGVSGAGAIATIQIGPRCVTVPNTVKSSNVTMSAYPTSVSLNWPETPQPPDVAAIGITEWLTLKNGAFYGDTAQAAAWTDPNVTPSQTYTYAIAPVSFHGVAAAYSSAITVGTPPALNVDPLRTGVRPIGTYWGSAPENIDMGSGNLNVTIPLLRPQGRGGWSVPISMNYNSQMWRNDSGGTQSMGLDVGYGFGWRMLAGSITPYWNSQTLKIDHYLYIDATGGQYRLYPSGTGSIWISLLYPVAQGSIGESIYVYYDSVANMLHFRDGSSWLMGSMSSGEEQDAGTLYPTILQDRNGNQVIMTYGPGLGTEDAADSSARIVSIEDTRATGSPRTTYNFTYAPPDVNGIQHLLTISNTIGTSENYSFAVVPNLTWTDPFQPQTITVANSTGLASITNTSLNTSYRIFTDIHCQMLQLQLPFGGYMRWTYGSNTYQWTANTILLNAVTGRFIAAAASASNTYNAGKGATEWAYPITYTAAPMNESIVAGSSIADSTSGAQRQWTFQNGASSGIPVTTSATQLGMVSGTLTKLVTDAYGWAHDPAGNAYVYQDLKTDMTAASGVLYSQVQQTLDAYGNVTGASTWDYSTSSPTGTATRITNSTYDNSCSSPWTGSTAGACPYVNAFILSLPLTSTLTSGSNTTTMLSNTYDTYSKYPLTNVTGLSEFDSAYTASVTTRGNVTTTVTPGSTHNIGYDVTGAVTAADDNNNHAISVTTAAGTNNSAPGTIQPNTGLPGDSSMATALSYSPFLAVSTAAAPNGASINTTYDKAGRVSTTQLPSHSVDGQTAGATTTYTYAFGTVIGGNIGNGAYTTTATTNGHWATSIADGLGRTVTQTTGYGTPPGTTISKVDTLYGAAACSPAGMTISTSQPYAVGASEVWSSYVYDGLGRTLSAALPDGSTTKYTFQGNWTTVVDPAGKWKQYQNDVFGNVLNVVEPDPGASPLVPVPPPSPSTTKTGTLLTAYTYDLANHLTNVSMGRGAVTQTRVFAFDPVTFRLTSSTSPETGTAAANGTTSYIYYGDGTVATRTDAKNQTTTYDYDSYQRLTAVFHAGYSAQNYIYSYDSDPLGSYSSNAIGQLAAVQWGPAGVCSLNGVYLYGYSEEYAYNPAGQIVGKQLTVNKNNNGTCSPVVLAETLVYDTEGKLISTTTPEAQGGSDSLTFTNTYDSMSRLTGVSDYEHGYGCVGLTVNWGSGGTYNAAGQMAGLQRLQSVGPCSGTGSGTPEFFNEAWIYNTANLLTEIDTSAQSGGYPIGVPSPGPATHASFFAEYNYTAGANNGQVASVTDARTNATSTYGYDLLRRLNSASTGTWAQSYSYDGFGNLATKTVPPNSAEPAFPGVNSAKNWLSGATYDANGNTVALNTAGYGYDVENRMISFTSGNFVENYAYDENNHRIERSSASADTVYFYGAGGNLLGSYMITFPGGVNYAASVIAQQVYFGGMVIGQTKGTDFSGDASTLTDRLGTAVPGYPYGTDIGNPPAGDQVDFATYTKEPNSGLEYANQRYYSAGMGRFMTADPSVRSAHIASPGSWNRYLYAKNDPVDTSDPSGLDPNCGPNMVWDGEGCTNGAGTPLPDASVGPSVNPYAITSSQGNPISTGSFLGALSGDLQQAYNNYAAEMAFDFPLFWTPPNPACVQAAITAAATAANLDLTIFTTASVQIVNLLGPNGNPYTETELILGGALPGTMPGFIEALCNLGFASNYQCPANNTSLVGPPHSGFSGNFRSPGLIGSVQVNTNSTGVQIDVDPFNPAAVPPLGAVLHALGQWLPNQLIGTDNSYNCGP